MKTLVILIAVLYCGLQGSTPLACEKCSSSDKCDVGTTLATRPAGCSLSSTEYSNRMSETGSILARCEATRELDDGYSFQFPGDDVELAARLTGWVVAERQCCSFFRFELTFAADQGPIWVSLGGGKEAKDLLSSLLKTAVTNNGSTGE